MRYDHTRKHAQGFTLVEALVVLAITGLLAMIGTPAMAGLLARNRQASTADAVVDALQRTRAAAVMQNGRVLLCPSRDGHRCDAGDEWQNGWLIARDADHDGQPDAGVQVILAHAALAAGTRVVTSRGRGRVAFHPNGSAAGSNVRFTVCQARLRDGKDVLVSNSGRVRISAADPVHLQACLAETR